MKTPLTTIITVETAQALTGFLKKTGITKTNAVDTAIRTYIDTYARMQEGTKEPTPIHVEPRKSVRKKASTNTDITIQPPNGLI